MSDQHPTDNLPIAETKSISSHYARILYQSAQMSGLNADQLLENSDIAAELAKLPQYDHQVRITPPQFASLLLNFWIMADDEFLGLTDSPCKHGTFALMARQAVNCANLKDVYRHINRFYSLFTDACDLGLEVEGNEARFLLNLKNPEKDQDNTYVEFFLMLWHRFPGWLCGRFLPLEAVWMTCEPPPHAREFRLIFPAPVHFGMPSNALVFNSELLDIPVVQTSASLKEHLDDAPLVWVSKPVIYPRYSRKVLNLLKQSSTPDKLDMETIASQLHMTSRTLRRKLSSEHASFQSLKDKVRIDQAIQLLSQPDLTLAEISQTLGFSDPAAFSRAFKNWTGTAPSQYRLKATV
ncbi:MAG: AraC family transcriptional regulator [Oceanobacter sp.]